MKILMHEIKLKLHTSLLYSSLIFSNSEKFKYMLTISLRNRRTFKYVLHKGNANYYVLQTSIKYI